MWQVIFLLTVVLKLGKYWFFRGTNRLFYVTCDQAEFLASLLFTLTGSLATRFLRNGFTKRNKTKIEPAWSQVNFMKRVWLSQIEVANGLSKQFGSRKILADFHGSPVQRLSASRSLDFLTSVSFWPFVCRFWSPLWFINDGNLISKTIFGPFPLGVTMAKTFWQR